ncbi:MAG: hypothetical protein E6R03_04250 [Hyphomicrobiaceae bacterium]|nr:MAG: hypothetical protein E6R03_04250 [Hyphomicrobiaceae bacterium]
MAATTRQLPVAAAGAFDFWSFLGASKVAAVQASSTADYITTSAPNAAQSFTIDTTNLSQNHTIISVRLRAILSNPTNAPGADIGLGAFLGVSSLFQPFTPTASPVEYLTPEWLLNPNGSPWTYADIAALQIGAFATGSTNSERRVQYLVLEALVEPQAIVGLGANLIQGGCLPVFVGFKLQQNTKQVSAALGAKMVTQVDRTVGLGAKVRALTNAPVSGGLKIQQNAATPAYLSFQATIINQTPVVRTAPLLLAAWIQVQALRRTLALAAWVSTQTPKGLDFSVKVRVTGVSKPLGLAGEIRAAGTVPVGLGAKLREDRKSSALGLSTFAAAQTLLPQSLSIKVRKDANALSIGLGVYLVSQVSRTVGLATKVQVPAIANLLSLSTKLAATTNRPIDFSAAIRRTVSLSLSLAAYLTALVPNSVSLAAKVRQIGAQLPLSLATWLAKQTLLPIQVALSVRANGVNQSLSLGSYLVSQVSRSVGLATKVQKQGNVVSVGIEATIQLRFLTKSVLAATKIRASTDLSLSLATKLQAQTASNLALGFKVRATAPDAPVAAALRVQKAGNNASQALFLNLFGPDITPCEFALKLLAPHDAVLSLSAYLHPAALVLRELDLRARIKGPSSSSLSLSIKIDNVGVTYIPFACSVFIAELVNVTPQPLTGSEYIQPTTGE